MKSSKSTVMAPKNYRKPTLTALGDVRSITLGGSPGRGDSGDEDNTKT